MRVCIALFGLLTLAQPATVARAQAPEDVVPDSVTPQRVLAGSATFNTGSCIFCHAVAGRGSGRWAPDLSDKEWLHSEGDFDGIWTTIYWGVRKEEWKAKTPRRWEMHPKGGMSLDWEQTKEQALEERLDPSLFLRVRRSAIVNVSRIQHIELWANGEYLITLESGASVKSGAAYREALKTLMENPS